MSHPEIQNVAYDVAVVGFGPVGAIAAHLLGQRGIHTIVIDRTDQLFPLPRAIAFDHEIMRVFQNIGVADRIGEYIRPYPPSEYRGADGRVIARFDSQPPPYPFGWSPSYLFVQPPVENCIREAARSHESVSFILDSAVTGLVEDSALTGPAGDSSDDVVRLNLRSEDGRESTVAARYVMGCDGAGSTVRRSAGLELESLDFDEPWLVVDVMVEDEAALARLPSTNIQYCEPSRPCTYVVGAGRHRRWELMLLPDEDPDRIDVRALINRLLARWIDPSSVRLWRAAAYVFHALIARSWRRGRVFILGDAAHQTPPFLAQGMCQGIRDAANLAWKIDFALDGRAGANLLDSYEIERAPHVRQTTEIAKSFGRIICERDPAAAKHRDLRLRAESGDPPRVTVRQDLIPPLKAGAIFGAEPAGRLFPQPRVIVADGKSGLLDDFTGARMRLVVHGIRPDQIPASARALIERLGGVIVSVDLKISSKISSEISAAKPSVIAVREFDGLLASWFTRYGASAAIVRPDHYVFGVSADAGGIAALADSLESALG